MATHLGSSVTPTEHRHRYQIIGPVLDSTLIGGTVMNIQNTNMQHCSSSSCQQQDHVLCNNASGFQRLQLPWQLIRTKDTTRQGTSTQHAQAHASSRLLDNVLLRNTLRTAGTVAYLKTGLDILYLLPKIIMHVNMCSTFMVSYIVMMNPGKYEHKWRLTSALHGLLTTRKGKKDVDLFSKIVIIYARILNESR